MEKVYKAIMVSHETHYKLKKLAAEKSLTLDKLLQFFLELESKNNAGK